jgi:phosphoserine phosphatase RsbU/P
VQEGLACKQAGSFDIKRTRDFTEGLKLANSEAFNVAMLDLELPDGQGLAMIEEIRAKAPLLAIVIISHVDDEHLATQAVKAGAQDYLVKTKVNADVIWRVIGYAIERKHLEEALRKSHEQLGQLQKIQVAATLAGSVAHDMNNQLTPLMGYLDLMLSQATPDHPFYDFLSEAKKSGKGCAEVVQRLAGFSQEFSKLKT